MTYAVIEICGKQLKVETGRFYDVDRIGIELDGELVIDKVLLINHENQIHVGQPYVEGGSVAGTIIGHRRGKKVLVYKMKPKKKTRKKRGHRQELTRFMVNTISLSGNVLSEKSAETATAEVAVEA